MGKDRGMTGSVGNLDNGVRFIVVQYGKIRRSPTPLEATSTSTTRSSSHQLSQGTLGGKGIKQ